MPTGRKKRKDALVIEGKLDDKYLVQKSKPLFSLWNSSLTLAEFKILDVYLSRIDSHHPERRRVIFTKGELESLMNLKRIEPKELDKRLQNLMGKNVAIEDSEHPKGFARVVLFEFALCYKDDYSGLWTVELECSQSAMKYVFNIDSIGYLRYKIRSIINLTSVYSYILFTYLEYNRFRKTWTISVEDLKQVMNCTDASYSEFKLFNNRILKRCHEEIIEKTDLRFEYKSIKKGRKVIAIEFVVEEPEKDMIPPEPKKQMAYDSNLLNDSGGYPKRMTDFLGMLQEEVEEIEEMDYGSELANLLGNDACKGEFSPVQIRVLQDLVIQVVETSDPIQRCNYLAHKVNMMNAYDVNNKIKNRFIYLMRMIEEDIE